MNSLVYALRSVDARGTAHSPRSQTAEIVTAIKNCSLACSPPERSSILCYSLRPIEIKKIIAEKLRYMEACQLKKSGVTIPARLTLRLRPTRTIIFHFYVLHSDSSQPLALVSCVMFVCSPVV